MGNFPNREPDFARMKTVLTRAGEPDYVPFYELFADVEVMSAVIGRPAIGVQGRLDYNLALGYDSVLCFPLGLDFPQKGMVATDYDPSALSRGGRTFHAAGMNTISTWEDFESYPWPNPSTIDWSELDELARIAPPGIKAIVASGHVLEGPMGLLGYEHLSYLMADNPELVDAVFAKVGSIYEQTYKDCRDMGIVGAMLISDDLGFKSATMVSPSSLRRLVFPWYRRYTDICHAQGMPVILHSCGNLREVMEDIIADCQLDAKHSFEDQIMPVTAFKEAYGSRIATLGGLDLHFMCTATEDEVRRRTRETLEVCMPGGGYALGTGNSVANYVPLANYLAMLDEGNKVGRYR